ncbi:MAG: hypothetical protein DHS20C16_21820 [Phycisphaerae bacterium]|nr:MAG: hypothetical protein DHS20C16_21820 [Phycisphaerae bacterium]
MTKQIIELAAVYDCDRKYAPSDWRRDPHDYFSMGLGHTGDVDPDDIDDCMNEVCTNGFTVNGVGTNGFPPRTVSQPSLTGSITNHDSKQNRI